MIASKMFHFMVRSFIFGIPSSSQSWQNSWHGQSRASSDARQERPSSRGLSANRGAGKIWVSRFTPFHAGAIGNDNWNEPGDSLKGNHQLDGFVWVTPFLLPYREPAGYC